MLVLLLVAVIAVRHFNHIRLTFPLMVPVENRETFLNETREVESFTEPGSKIGMTGGGLVGYFIEDRTVVNLDGLINSVEYFIAMQAGTAKAFLDELSGRLIEIGLIHGYDDFILYRYEPNQ
jgi:hypothetical protein